MIAAMMMMMIMTVIKITITVVVIMMMMMIIVRRRRRRRRTMTTTTMIIIIIIIIRRIIIIIVVVVITIMMMMMTLTGAIPDCLQSPHCAANCLQPICSSGHRAVMCKSRATHLALITFSRLTCQYATWYEGTVRLRIMRELKSHLF